MKPAKTVLFIIVAVLVSLFYLHPVFAASGLDEGDEQPGVFTGDFREGIPLEDLSSTPSQGGPQAGHQRQPGQSGQRQFRDDAGIAGQAGSSPFTLPPSLKSPSALPSIKGSDEVLNQQQQKALKAKILLSGEAGDGLVALQWKMSGLQRKQGDLPVKYAIFLGLESGRYSKKLDVGTATEHRLRELKNHQIYYIKVQATGKTQDDSDDGEIRQSEISVFSNEIRLIPLPVEEQGSRLEKAFSGKVLTLQDKLEEDPFKRDLKQFGYDFFKNGQALAASETVPVGADYVVGPGDTLRIELWGTLQARHEVTVDRNGEIFIPKAGTVKVWGLTYNQAKDVINRVLSRYYKGYELNVTFGRLRSIQVFVVGEVEMPGAYSVSSVGTVINALAVAGGPSKNGSLRNITITRNGKGIQSVDLYDMFLSGDRSKDIRLESGDTIFVPVVGSVAAVAGEVKRPGIYELKGTTRLSDVLAMAGGISASGDQRRIQVERIEGNSARVVLDYEPKADQKEPFATIDIRDRDMVKVFPVRKAFREVVTLKGNVGRPGEYQFKKGMRVKDVIPTFESLLPDTYLDSAEIMRLVQPDFHKEPISFNLSKAIDGDEANNIPLQEQDTIRVFARGEMGEKQAVFINGFVLNPGGYDYYPQMTVRDLVTMAGSLKRSASLVNAELTRVSVVEGTARAERSNFILGKALAGDPAHNLVLHPDDTVIIRGIAEWTDAGDRFITLKGEVMFPGVYSITKGEKLSSVIARAGGFSQKAFLTGARFVRRSVKESQQKRMDEMLERTEQDILKKQGELASLAASREELEATKAALEGLMKSLDKLKASKAEGRVVIHLRPLSELQGSFYDLELMGGDVLEIPPRPSVVNVIGQVYNPTSFVYLPGENVSYYLKNAGGPTREAEEDDIYIIKADGTVQSRHNSSFGITWDESSRSWTFGSFLSRPLEPGETLVVPQKLERIAWMREIKDITTIISQIALTAGVIVAAGL